MAKKSRKSDKSNIPNYQPLSIMLEEQSTRSKFDQSIKDLQRDVESYKDLEVEIICNKSLIETLEADLAILSMEMDENYFYTLGIIELCKKNSNHNGAVFSDVVSNYRQVLDMLKSESLDDFDIGYYQEFIDKAMTKMNLIFTNGDFNNLHLICKILLSVFNRLNSSVESFSNKLSELKDVKNNLSLNEKSLDEAKNDLIESAKELSAVSIKLDSIPKIR